MKSIMLRSPVESTLANFALSEAIQKVASEDWIASSQELLAMTSRDCVSSGYAPRTITPYQPSPL
jgi:hypothetical protein